MRRNHVGLWIAAAVALASSAQGATITAVNGVTGGTNKTGFNGSLGFNFTVGSQDISVTALGYYAPYAPSGASNQVGIFTGAINGTATLLGSTTITSVATTSTPGWYYQTLTTPITLSANTTYNAEGADVSGTAVTTANGDYLTNATGSISYGTDITYNFMDYGGSSGSALVAPTNTFTGNNPGAFNPNFQYTVLATPEPASLTLFGLAAVGLLGRRRRA